MAPFGEEARGESSLHILSWLAALLILTCTMAFQRIFDLVGLTAVDFRVSSNVAYSWGGKLVFQMQF